MKLPRRRFLHLAAGTVALPALSPLVALGQGTTIATNAIMIVERTHYLAKPGLATEVLDLRRKACGAPSRPGAVAAALVGTPSNAIFFGWRTILAATHPLLRASRVMRGCRFVMRWGAVALQVPVEE